MCFRCVSVWGHCPADEPYLGAVASQTQIIPGGCGPGPAPTQHAQRCSSGEPEGPRDLRALLQGGPWKTLHWSQRDRPWQLWRGLLCKHQPYNPKKKSLQCIQLCFNQHGWLHFLSHYNLCFTHRREMCAPQRWWLSRKCPTVESKPLRLVIGFLYTFYDWSWFTLRPGSYHILILCALTAIYTVTILLSTVH